MKRVTGSWWLSSMSVVSMRETERRESLTLRRVENKWTSERRKRENEPNSHRAVSSPTPAFIFRHTADTSTGQFAQYTVTYAMITLRPRSLSLSLFTSSSLPRAIDWVNLNTCLLHLCWSHSQPEEQLIKCLNESLARPPKGAREPWHLSWRVTDRLQHTIHWSTWSWVTGCSLGYKSSFQWFSFWLLSERHSHPSLPIWCVDGEDEEDAGVEMQWQPVIERKGCKWQRWL